MPRLNNLVAAAGLACVFWFTMACGSAVPQPGDTGPLGPAPAHHEPAPAAVRESQACWPGQHLSFDTLSVAEGLSQSTVFCMFQDERGFLWFGTEDGLNRYDGYGFQVYRHEASDLNSLSDSWITSMAGGQDGVFWIGTDAGGLVRYDPRQRRFDRHRHDPDDLSSLSDDRITALCRDSRGVLWVGMADGSIDRFDLSTARFEHHRPPGEPHPVTAICQGNSGELWIATDGGGLWLFVPGEDAWRHHAHDPADADSLSDDAVTAVLRADSGDVWVGTARGGLNRLMGEDGKFTHYRYDAGRGRSLSSDKVSAIHQDRDGVLWVATRDAGINRLLPGSEAFERHRSTLADPDSLGSDIIVSIYEDREGVLWFGTIGGGASKLDLSHRSFAHFVHTTDDKHGPGDNMVRAFHRDGLGRLWVGTMTGGIDQYDPQDGTWRHYVHDASDPTSVGSNWIWRFYKDQGGSIWVGTYEGLDQYVPELDSFLHYRPLPEAPPGTASNSVRAVYEDDAGIFWVGTTQGLYRFNPSRPGWDQDYAATTPNLADLADAWIVGLASDRQGKLWIGTRGLGLYGLDLASGSVSHYAHDPDDPTSLGDNLVTAILEDRDGGFWVGGLAGLDKLDRQDGTFEHLGASTGLDDSVVYCVVEDAQGYLWVSTNSGLSRLDPDTMSVIEYDVADGLQSNEFNGGACMACDDGTLYFGGINGYNAFVPEAIVGNRVSPMTALTAISQGETPIVLRQDSSGRDSLVLKWPDNGFEFEFAALSFADPSANQYAYILEGFDETWHEVGARRTGQYTNLPGGNYTLRLKGSNNEGVWSTEGVEVAVTVVPPFWSTWWFRMMAVITVAVMGWGVSIWRIRTLDARRRHLEQQVFARTQELAGLNAVSAVVGQSLDLDQVLDGALNETRHVVGASGAGIYLIDPETQELELRMHKGLPPGLQAVFQELNDDLDYPGQVVATGEPKVITELPKQSQLAQFVDPQRDTFVLIIVPLVARSQALGALFVATRRGRGFVAQKDLLVAIGAQVGVAVENARLYEQAQQMAIVEERQRLARELHDSVTQSLHSSALMAEAGQRLAAQGDMERTRHYLQRLGEISQQALREMRLMVYELRPLVLAQEGLESALRRRLEAVEMRAGIEARLEVERGAEPAAVGLTLDPDVEETLYRIAQEALNNALKHADAHSVLVRLAIAEKVTLEIRDDGKGFDPDTAGGGIGLTSMRERAIKVGSVLEIESQPRVGTRVRVTIERRGEHPCDAEDALQSTEGIL